MKPSLLLALVIGFTVLAVPGISNTAMFTSLAPNTANTGQPLDASALFSLTGNQLTIEVTNTASGQTSNYVDADVLTGVFFSSQPLDLTPVSAVADKTVSADGSTQCAGLCDIGVGWEFRSLTVADLGMMNGISAVESPKFLFSNFTPNGDKLRGTGYGIVPDSYQNVGSTLTDPTYTEGSATFTLNVPASFTLAQIDRVAFIWGTSANDPFAFSTFSFFQADDAAPEPSSWVLVASFIAFMFRRIARRT
jgi:hypothetical protein